jgi:hypothetical protein
MAVRGLCRAQAFSVALILNYHTKSRLYMPALIASRRARHSHSARRAPVPGTILHVPGHDMRTQVRVYTET